jgi:tetratricopeptide (TPR) repeat protein
MKIVVYAISKNESKFVSRFCESTKDADSVYIIDTGSNDDTVKIAKECGAIVYPISVKPWRFDDARNAALAILPVDADICVSVDMDEVLEPGWRKIVSDNWVNGVNRLKYLYDWGRNTVFYSDKIHSRFGFRWKYPCHEVLVCDPRSVENVRKVDQLLISHLPDEQKSRDGYLEVLKCGVEENPLDARSSFYYGRELYFKSKYREAINEFTRYTELPTAVWNAEKSYAMRLIGRCNFFLENLEEELKWCNAACSMAPERRESWYYLARAFYNQKRWQECYDACNKAIEISEFQNDWPHEPEAWGYLVFDLAAISAYWINRREEAHQFGILACQMNPTDERLKSNLDWYTNERR